jgi:hypothetical protein
VKDKVVDQTGDLYAKIVSQYAMATAKQIIAKGEKNWYMFCHLGIVFLEKNGFAAKTIHQLIAEHIIDELYLPEIILILNDYTKNPLYETQEVFKYIKTYIDRQVMITKKLQGFLWREKSNQVLMIKNSEGAAAWQPAEAEDLKDFQPNLAEKKTNLIANLNALIGFMNNFKTEEYVVFKTKNITNPRDAGARCDQNSNKEKGIDILNSIVGTYIEPPSTSLSKNVICIIQELYLRLFDKERKNKKRWFLSPPEAVLVNIEKYSTVVKKAKKNAKE